jgi:hypothetical protein
MAQERPERVGGMGGGHPPKPGRGGRVGREPFGQIRLAQEGGRVQRHDPADALRAARRETHADQTAEAVHHQAQPPEVELQNQPLQIVDMILESVAPVRRSLALAEPHHVGRDHAMALRPLRDGLAEQEAPGGLAMEQQERLGARALVDVVHCESRRAREARRKGPGPVEGLLGSDAGAGRIVGGAIQRQSRKVGLADAQRAPATGKEPLQRAVALEGGGVGEFLHRAAGQNGHGVLLGRARRSVTVLVDEERMRPSAHGDNPLRARITVARSARTFAQPASPRPANRPQSVSVADHVGEIGAQPWPTATWRWVDQSGSGARGGSLSVQHQPQAPSPDEILRLGSSARSPAHRRCSVCHRRGRPRGWSQPRSHGGAHLRALALEAPLRPPLHSPEW